MPFKFIDSLKNGETKLIFDSIEDENTKGLIEWYYLLQMVFARAKSKSDDLLNEHLEKFIRIKRSLESAGFEFRDLKPPKDIQNPDYLERKMAEFNYANSIKEVALLDGDIIEPPNLISQKASLYIQQTRAFWI